MEFVARIWFAITIGWQERSALKALSRDPLCHTPRLSDLDPRRLRSNGISVLVLDFDGVIAPHGNDHPSPASETWIREASGHFAQGHVFILTNRPNQAREKYFKTHFPQIQFIHAKKKPYPNGLLEITKLTQVQPKAILLVDDRLLTGALAAILAKVSFMWVRNPLIDLKKRPFVEGAFIFLRFFERIVIKL